MSDAISERWPVDKLHHERTDAVRLLETVDLGNVRLIHGSQRLRLALEPRNPLGIGRERLRQDLDRDVPIELPIAGAIHFPHPTAADKRDDLIAAVRAPRSQHSFFSSAVQRRTTEKRWPTFIAFRALRVPLA